MHSDLPSLQEAARLLGGKVANGNHILCPGPGHGKDDRSLSVKFSRNAREGFIVYSFAGDDPGDCRDHVRERLGLPDWRSNPGTATVPRRQPRRLVANDNNTATVTAAINIWRATVTVKGTAGEAYLRSRDLAWRSEYDGAVRFHRGLQYDGRTLPALVALLRDILTDEPCGVHRTYLDDDARKIDRRMLGRAKRAAIKLDAHEDVTLGLSVGEGIETCMAGRQLGYVPAWALGSAGAIANFPVLAGIEAIVCFAENDNASMSRNVASGRRSIESAAPTGLTVATRLRAARSSIKVARLGPSQRWSATARRYCVAQPYPTEKCPRISPADS
jgi:hypothetical protein